MVKYDCLAQRSNEKGSDLRYIMKVEPVKFVKRLVVGGKRKRN